jgi:integrase
MSPPLLCLGGSGLRRAVRISIQIAMMAAWPSAIATTPADALQRMLGHTSAKVTLDTYADLFDDDLDAVAVTLDSRYSRGSVDKMWPMGTSGTR